MRADGMIRLASVSSCPIPYLRRSLHALVDPIRFGRLSLTSIHLVYIRASNINISPIILESVDVDTVALHFMPESQKVGVSPRT